MKQLIIPKKGEDLMALARKCEAVYICPKDAAGNRMGPLVPYAGKDASGNNLVGDIYYNFRRIEPHTRVVIAYAEAACTKLYELGLMDTFDTVVGIPQGGRSFGQMLALVAGKGFAYADKKAKPTPEGFKQEYDWDLSQFEFEHGERVAFAEDVFNNLQNTDNTMRAISETGAVVTLLVGALNRSPIYNIDYKGLPLVTSIRKEYPEYEQGDPEVAADVAKKNIEWNVKKNWSRLLQLSAVS